MIPNSYDMNYPIEWKQCPSCRWCRAGKTVPFWCSVYDQAVDITGHCEDFATDRRIEERRKS
jgi:hypothetical protein